MNLIIQGLEVNNSDLRALAKLSQANGIERITGHAFRLTNAIHSNAISEYCTQAELDFAFVNLDLKLSDFKLIAMGLFDNKSNTFKPKKNHGKGYFKTAAIQTKLICISVINTLINT